MSKALSLKLEEHVFAETERVVRRLRTPRNAYINRALDFYNRYQKRRLVKKTLRGDVRRLKADTQHVAREFELLDDLPV